MQLYDELKYGAYRNLTIRISRTGKVTVSAPASYSEETVKKIVTEKEGWIKKQLLKIKKSNLKIITINKGEILYLGEIYRFEKNHAMGKSYSINEISKTIASGIDFSIKNNLLKFYNERAKFILVAKTYKMAEAFGFTITKAQVRNSQSRFGSCTSKKVITLSTRLIMTPLFVIDAIILHELTHIKFMNHSKKYYSELRSLCPRYDEAELWLKEKMPVEFPPEIWG